MPGHAGAVPASRKLSKTLDVANKNTMKEKKADDININMSNVINIKKMKKQNR